MSYPWNFWIWYTGLPTQKMSPKNQAGLTKVYFYQADNNPISFMLNLLKAGLKQLPLGQV